jgi:exopolysaccharide biosynthesis predicted pyruvyltransferase EpsI
VNERPGTVADLRAALHAELARFIPRGSHVALLDFPAYQNVGDSAIWLGTVAVLQALDCRIGYVCDQGSYSREALEARLPPGAPVLLQGGGNFGDLWPPHQRFRELVIGELADRPIIQLPVSIDFREPGSVERSRGVLNRHERLTLLVRDRKSLAYAEAHFDARSLLCPDAALALTPPRRGRAETDVVVLERSDKEQLRPLPTVPGARVLDWSSGPGEPGYSWWWEQKVRVARRVGTRRLFDSLARQRVEFGYSLVASGRVLLTDRLHGHILALLMETPHVVVETGYGKIRDFHESFSGGIPGAVLCDPADAEHAVRELLAADSTGG